MLLPLCTPRLYSTACAVIVSPCSCWRLGGVVAWCGCVMCSSIGNNLNRQPLLHGYTFAAGFFVDVRPHPWLGRRNADTTPAAIRAQRAIAAVSPVRERDRRAERRRLVRDRRRRAKAAILRGMREVLGLPLQHRRRRRQQQQPRVDNREPIVLSSDSSGEEPELQPVVVNLDSSLESLPNIDPRPQFQLPVEPPQELGHLNITLEFPPPLQHQALREAFVLLSRLQLPPLQPLTPPPEFPLRPQTPPEEQAIDWEGLEVAVAAFDEQQHLAPPPLLAPQEPDVVLCPQFVPAGFAQRPLLPQVDWAMVAYALFTVAEQESQRRRTN